MSEDQHDPEVVARATLTLLETRLRRLEYLLMGELSPRQLQHDSEATLPIGSSNVTASTRMFELQSTLDDLRKLKGPAGNLVRDVESLQSKVPELFAISTSSSLPTTSDLATTSALVLSHASLFPETASRLSSLQTLQIPAADLSSKLIDLRPRIDEAIQKQLRLQQEADELRERSARCLEWWVSIGAVGLGELWEEWESRVTDVERDLKRAERRRIIEDQYA